VTGSLLLVPNALRTEFIVLRSASFFFDEIDYRPIATVGAEMPDTGTVLFAVGNLQHHRRRKNANSMPVEPASLREMIALIGLA
jgi:hypothetical protein